MSRAKEKLSGLSIWKNVSRQYNSLLGLLDLRQETGKKNCKTVRADSKNVQHPFGVGALAVDSCTYWKQAPNGVTVHVHCSKSIISDYLTGVLVTRLATHSLE